MDWGASMFNLCGGLGPSHLYNSQTFQSSWVCSSRWAKVNQWEANTIQGCYSDIWHVEICDRDSGLIHYMCLCDLGVCVIVQKLVISCSFFEITACVVVLFVFLISYLFIMFQNLDFPWNIMSHPTSPWNFTLFTLAFRYICKNRTPFPSQTTFSS